MPTDLVSIGNSAFADCKALTNVRIPDGVTQLGHSVFKNCGALTDATLPAGLRALPDSAFYNCALLRTVTLPDTLTQIGNYAFYGCAALSDLTIPVGLTQIGDSALARNGLQEIFYCGDAAQWSAIRIGNDNAALDTLTRYDYSETAPADAGNYWHYDADGTTIVKW